MFYNSILFKMEETFELYILVEFTLNGKGNIGYWGLNLHPNFQKRGVWKDFNF